VRAALNETPPGDAPQRTIFPDSALSKRVAVAAMRLYGKVLPGVQDQIRPTDSSALRILIQTMGGIGNSLMATPLIAATRQLYPNARIDVLTSPATAPLLATNPHATNVLTDPPADGQGMWPVVRGIRAARYDAAIAALNSHLSKNAARIVLGKIPRRIMHEYPFRAYDNFLGAFTHVVPRARGKHDVARNMDLLHALSGEHVDPGPLVLPLNEAAKATARAVLAGAGWNPERVSVAICPGSSGWMAFKRWPIHHAMALADCVLQRRDAPTVLTLLGPDEQEDVRAWRERFGSRVILIEGLDVTAYAAALAQMSAVIANDSLPMHLCAALQVPVVALFGPTDPAQTGPWKGRAIVISADTDFTPFYTLPYPVDPGQFPDSMETITPESVEHAVDQLLARR